MPKLQLSDLPESLDEMLNQLETGKVDFEDLPDEAKEFIVTLAIFALLNELSNSII